MKHESSIQHCCEFVSVCYKGGGHELSFGGSFFMTHTHYLHLLNCIESLSLPAQHRLLAVAGSPERAWRADTSLLRRARIKNGPDVILAREKISIDAEHKKIEALSSLHGIHLLSRAELPESLRELTNAPHLLYARGNTQLLKEKRMLAVVGSRKATSYGKRVIRESIPKLTQIGVTIVSGLALGIDAAAHKRTLESDGKTIAVLGSSLLPDEITPPSNQALARRILDNGGLLLSEYPPGSPGYASHFPERNRIIAGLSQGTLVVEAALKSGSLITARLASECSRDVFSVPGPITAPQSAGTNQLIERGAIPFTSCTTVTDALRWLEPQKQETVTHALIPQEQSIYEACRNEPLTLENIVETANLQAHEVLMHVTRLTLQGVLTRTEDNRYQSTP
jgi:DNA processing protein